MTGNEYQELAMRTNCKDAKERLDDKLHNNMLVNFAQVINASLGLSGEVGELNDMIKKFAFHGTPMDESHFMKEVGDICWYIAQMCDACGYKLDDILDINIDKLKARYPEGFDTVRANNRASNDV